ncbi:hypothetical protein HK405_015247, partial [Cladochytrium tenue]
MEADSRCKQASGSVDSLLRELASDSDGETPMRKVANPARDLAGGRAEIASGRSDDGGVGLTGEKLKCSPPLVGGARDPTIGGSSGGANRGLPGTGVRACGRLRCLACDFACLRFSGSAWSARADYLFFRNYVPDEARLAACLVPKE